MANPRGNKGGLRRRGALIFRVCLGMMSISLCLVVFSLWRNIAVAWNRTQTPTADSSIDDQSSLHSDSMHPISLLITQSSKSFAKAMQDEPAISLEDAAAKYRKRRRRHPPPGFDAWYAFSQATNTIIAEPFWDQIYEDLEPFRGLDPPEVRRRARSLSPRISIQDDGNISIEGVGKSQRGRVWSAVFEELISRKEVWMPEVELSLPLNMNDVPGVLLQWEELDELLGGTGRPMLMPDPDDVKTNYANSSSASETGFDAEWLGPLVASHSEGYLGPRPYRPLWTLVQPGCPPYSAARAEDAMFDIWHPQGHTDAEHSVLNLLSNRTSSETPNTGRYHATWDEATNICSSPNLQGLHGAFVAPENIHTTTKLIPLLGRTSKLSVNNDILMPSAGEWNATSTSTSTFTSASSPELAHYIPWEYKNSTLHWRGPATGGKNTEQNWRRFHRHRFVSMLNATHVALAEMLLHSNSESVPAAGPAENFRLSTANAYNVSSQREGRLAEWVGTWADAAFTDLRCDVFSKEDACPYNSDFFSVHESDPETSSHSGNQGHRFKFTAVLDGSSDSDESELTTKLKSGSLVLRASVYRDWKDKRLVPWVHYVPMDNRFGDVYGIMEYFLSHDDAARRIAESGRVWAERVLRREDMLVYVYRLVLEYARILDDSRERLGWVDDLRGRKGE